MRYAVFAVITCVGAAKAIDKHETCCSSNSLATVSEIEMHERGLWTSGQAHVGLFDTTVTRGPAALPASNFGSLDQPSK